MGQERNKALFGELEGKAMMYICFSALVLAVLRLLHLLPPRRRAGAKLLPQPPRTGHTRPTGNVLCQSFWGWRDGGARGRSLSVSDDSVVPADLGCGYAQSMTCGYQVLGCVSTSYSVSVSSENRSPRSIYFLTKVCCLLHIGCGSD